MSEEVDFSCAEVGFGQRYCEAEFLRRQSKKSSDSVDTFSAVGTENVDIVEVDKHAIWPSNNLVYDIDKPIRRRVASQ